VGIFASIGSSRIIVVRKECSSLESEARVQRVLVVLIVTQNISVATDDITTLMIDDIHHVVTVTVIVPAVATTRVVSMKVVVVLTNPEVPSAITRYGK
jgi:hypothetical protein